MATAVDDLSLEQPVDRLGQGIVVTVAHAADGRFDSRLSQSLGVANGQILRSAIRVMNQTRSGLSLMHGLLRSIQNKPGMGRPTDPPSHNAARKGIDDKGYVNEALPSGDIGEIIRHCRSDQWRDNGSSHSMFGAGALN